MKLPISSRPASRCRLLTKIRIRQHNVHQSNWFQGPSKTVHRLPTPLSSVAYFGNTAHAVHDLTVHPRRFLLFLNLKHLRKATNEVDFPLTEHHSL
jgi:hypothetical protein